MPINKERLEELIDTCASKIEHKDLTVADINKSDSPIIMFYMGKDVSEQSHIIREIIDGNWRKNSRYICHIGVSLAEKKLILNDLVDNTLLPADGQSNVLDLLVRKVLAAPIGTFDDSKTVKVKFILLSSDSDNDRYIEFAKKIESELSSNLFKDLYILLHEGGGVNDSKKTKNFIKLLYANERENALKEFKQIYVISDRMKNGQFLQKHEKKNSFRLIADAVLITDSSEDGHRKRELFYGATNSNYRTLSHRMVQKPVYEITCVVLKTILKIILETKAINREKINSMFESEQFEEKYFESNFSKFFPTAEAFKYLPYTESGRNNMQTRFKTDKKNGVIHIDATLLDDETNGCFNEYYKVNYIEHIRSNFNKEDFRNKLTDYYISKYTYKDIEEFFKYEEVVDIACKEQEIHIDAERTSNLYAALQKHCELSARNFYFAEMRDTYLMAMKSLYSASVNYEKLIFDVLNEISCMYYLQDGGITKSIENYYSEYVREFLTKNSDIVDEIFTIRIQDDIELTEALKKVFGKILMNDFSNKLTGGFKDELNQRLGNEATPSARDALIRDELQPNIDDYTRMHVAIDNISEMYDAYMYSKKSDFMYNIGDAEIFCTNDENIFEHLKFYKFESIRDIYGAKTEEL